MVASRSSFQALLLSKTERVVIKKNRALQIATARFSMRKIRDGSVNRNGQSNDQSFEYHSTQSPSITSLADSH